jgi:hypothetical protein
MNHVNAPTHYLFAVEVAKDQRVIHTLPEDRQIRIANRPKQITSAGGL